MKKFVDLQLTASPPPTHTNTGSFNRLKKMTRTSVIRGGGTQKSFFSILAKNMQNRKKFSKQSIYFLWKIRWNIT